jgi:hypothetical protein
MSFSSDIDIDFGDREQALQYLKHIPAAMLNVEKPRRHNSGIHITEIPYDSATNMSALDYTEAEKRGYIKIDFLNVHVYKLIRDEAHLVEMMREPEWSKLQDAEFVEKLIHLNGHYDTLINMPEPVNSIPRLAMFLALIRPGKRHLIGKNWREIADTIWDRDDDSGYSFKKAHAISYAQLVVVHMNLIADGITEPVLPVLLIDA